MPVVPKTDLLLINDELISGGGGASGTEHLETENMWEKLLCRDQDPWERRGRGSPGPEQRFFSCLKRTPWSGSCGPAAPGCVQWSREPPADPGGPHTTSEGCSQRNMWKRKSEYEGNPQAPVGTCGPVHRGAHHGAGFLAGLVTLWGTHAEAVHKQMQPIGIADVGEAHEGWPPMGEALCRKREQRKSIITICLKPVKESQDKNNPSNWYSLCFRNKASDRKKLK